MIERVENFLATLKLKFLSKTWGFREKPRAPRMSSNQYFSRGFLHLLRYLSIGASYPLGKESSRSVVSENFFVFRFSIFVFRFSFLDFRFSFFVFLVGCTFSFFDFRFSFFWSVVLFRFSFFVFVVGCTFFVFLVGFIFSF